MNRTELPAFEGLRVWQWAGGRQNEADAHQVVVGAMEGKGAGKEPGGGCPGGGSARNTWGGGVNGKVTSEQRAEGARVTHHADKGGRAVRA